MAYVDYPFQDVGGLRGSLFTSLWWQMDSFTSLWWLALIAVCKPFVSDGVVYKPLVAYVDRRSQTFGGRWSHLQAFGGIRGSSCTRFLMAHMDRRAKPFGGIRGLSIAPLWWLTWIAVHKPLVADGFVYKPLGANVDVMYKPLVAYVDRCLQAFGGRWSLLQAFGGIRGSSFTSLWWLLLWITSLWWQMEYFTNLWGHTGILVSRAFGGRWGHLQAIGGIRGSSCTRLLLACVDRRVEAFGGIRGLSFPSRRWLTWIAVHMPLVADGVVYKPLVACLDRR